MTRVMLYEAAQVLLMRLNKMVPAYGTAGPGNRPLPHGNTESNPIGENASSTAQWYDVPRGTMDEARSYVRLDLPSA